MSIEKADYITELNTLYPLIDDNLSQGDDQIRLIKKVIKQTFPNIDNEITPSSEQFNKIKMEEKNYDSIKNPREEDLREPENIDENVEWNDINLEAQVTGSTFESGKYDPENDVPNPRPEDYPDTLSVYEIHKKIEDIKKKYQIPVGGVLPSYSSINPSKSIEEGGIGYGTWIRYYDSLFVSSIGEGTDSNGVKYELKEEITNGYILNVLKEEQFPKHEHNYTLKEIVEKSNNSTHFESTNTKEAITDLTPSVTFRTEKTGKSAPIKNTPPAYGMYMWIRRT